MESSCAQERCLGRQRPRPYCDGDGLDLGQFWDRFWRGPATPTVVLCRICLRRQSGHQPPVQPVVRCPIKRLKRDLRRLVPAGTDMPPLPCGVSGIDVTGASMPIRSYDYTYYCDGSFRFHVSALFDTRPLSNDPADANNHRAFEMLKDGDTQIIVNWSCPTDPWGLVDTTSCTPARRCQRPESDVQLSRPERPATAERAFPERLQSPTACRRPASGSNARPARISRSTLS